MELRDGERKRGPLLVHLEPAVPEAVPQNFQLCKPMHFSFLIEPVGVVLPSLTTKTYSVPSAYSVPSFMLNMGDKDFSDPVPTLRKFTACRVDIQIPEKYPSTRITKAER